METIGGGLSTWDIFCPQLLRFLSQPHFLGWHLLPSSPYTCVNPFILLPWFVQHLFLLLTRASLRGFNLLFTWFTTENISCRKTRTLTCLLKYEISGREVIAHSWRFSGYAWVEGGWVTNTPSSRRLITERDSACEMNELISEWLIPLALCIYFLY